MQRIKIMLMYLGVIILAACQNSSGFEMNSTVESPIRIPLELQAPTKTMSPQQVVTDDIETISPSSTLSVIEPNASLYEVTNVPSGYIGGINWSVENGQVFLFDNSGDAPGKTQWWAYDLTSKELQPVAREIAIEKISTDVNVLPIEVDTSTLDSLELVNISPNKEKVLFLEGTGSPTATPPPNPDGEVSNEAYIANVWIWEQDEMNQLGQIEICGLNQYLWTMDEQLVAIQAPGIPSQCREANAWLADTENNIIKPLLPFEIYYGDANLVSFSPNEDRLLIHDRGPDNDGNFNPVGILDINSGSVFKADIQAIPLDWVNNNQILIKFRNIPEEILRPGILDLQNNQVLELLTREQISMFSDKTIRWLSLSPDKQWLIFTVDEVPYKESSLWVIAIN